ncbi:MAG: 4Fe-4S binding protein [Gammaproteobacteria bacterium]|nr:4Fe-4S binding protein [Gammaproteobacteria bacterium]MBU1723980.1 4Fe-4S binding protein [Gammaproteobacteria bacterium]MBU2007173.1 4Fe-4S binding protein [Gammaproteobacteria bacterium]
MQHYRTLARLAFFLLFMLAPPLDLFRFDLTVNHLFFLGEPWRLGFTAQSGSLEMVSSIFYRIFLPIFLVISVGGWVAWKYGRLYCGWLCPHFAVVEIINALMRRSSGKPSLWEKQRLPEHQSDGRHIPHNRWYWLVTAVVVVMVSLLWAVVLLTYLLPPKDIYTNLLTFSLTRNQALFIGVGTLLLIIEFTLARHLFCRFGCALGVMQSVIWMGNREALVVGFDSPRAKLCADCDASCEHACPMRLKPRTIKRKMFTCTQCHSCIDACGKVQEHASGVSLLHWVQGEQAKAVAKGAGQPPRLLDSSQGDQPS